LRSGATGLQFVRDVYERRKRNEVESSSAHTVRRDLCSISCARPRSIQSEGEKERMKLVTASKRIGAFIALAGDAFLVVMFFVFFYLPAFLR